MKNTLLSFFIVMLFACKCNAKGELKYLYYHECIRTIENDFFEKRDTTKNILARYSELFEEYDFVYLQDCYTAMQLAILLGDEQYFMKFAEIATKNGLNKSNLSNFRYILQSDFYRNNEAAISSLITVNRPHYLSRINKELLTEVIKIYALDQAQKNGFPGESFAHYNDRYKKAYNAELMTLLELVKKYGMPCDRLIGVDQNDILKELGVHDKDLKDYYKMYKEAYNTTYNVTRSQYELEDQFAASTLLIPLMWHGHCSYSTLRPFLKDELEKGNIHPRDIAIIKDEDYRTMNVCETARDSVYYNIGNELLLKLPRQKVNLYRTRNFICSLESDSVKIIYQNKYKMTLSYGFVGKR